MEAEGAYAGYAEPEKRPPFATYGALATAFNAGFAGMLVQAHRSGRLPERIDAVDIVLFGAASHKLSRLVTKSKVTSFLRGPFTQYEGSGGPGEVKERARGTGARRAVGELLVCPYCLGLWVAAGLHAGRVYAPRATRVFASTFAALTISDFLQIAYKAAESRGLGD